MYGEILRKTGSPRLDHHRASLTLLDLVSQSGEVHEELDMSLRSTRLDLAWVGCWHVVNIFRYSLNEMMGSSKTGSCPKGPCPKMLTSKTKAKVCGKNATSQLLWYNIPSENTCFVYITKSKVTKQNGFAEAICSQPNIYVQLYIYMYHMWSCCERGIVVSLSCHVSSNGFQLQWVTPGIFFTTKLSCDIDPLVGSLPFQAFIQTSFLNTSSKGN